jgi:hypothetical protein
MSMSESGACNTFGFDPHAMLGLIAKIDEAKKYP